MLSEKRDKFSRQREKQQDYQTDVAELYVRRSEKRNSTEKISLGVLIQVGSYSQLNFSMNANTVLLHMPVIFFRVPLKYYITIAVKKATLKDLFL